MNASLEALGISPPRRPRDLSTPRMPPVILSLAPPKKAWNRTRLQTNLKHSPKLAILARMPLDVLLEISSNLGSSYDLLQLSRVCHRMHKELLLKATAGAWRSARRNDELPGLPGFISEPAWAQLVYGSECSLCGLNMGMYNLDWMLFKRLCKLCESQKTLQLVPPLSPLQAIVASLVPYRSHDQTCLLEDYNITLAYISKANATQKESFIAMRSVELEKQKMISIDCTVWSERKTHELEKFRRTEREIFFRGKLIVLGYEKQLAVVPDPNHQYLVLKNNAKLVNGLALKPSTWSKSQGEAVAMMNRIEEYQRKMLAIETLRLFKISTLPYRHFLPDPVDFCNLREIHSILEQPWNMEITLESFDPVKTLLPTVCAAWAERKKAVLQARTGVNVNLATSILYCKACHTKFWLESSIGFYPEFLSHMCLSRRKRSRDVGLTVSCRFLQSKQIPELEEGCLWTCDRLRVDPKMQRRMCEIIIAGNLDPETATIDDMDNLQVLFGCQTCQNGRGYFGWRRAIEHTLSGRHNKISIPVHWITKPAVDFSPSTSLLHLGIENLPVWNCVLCLDTPDAVPATSLLGIKEHLRDSHLVHQPFDNIHFFQKFPKVTIAHERYLV
ncbi:hypothetical protein C8J56DRAFT_930498 [Mycena floridula]|nr:hypothetical protein C8J56DRAFT_930498 [Mycena floridula]